MQKLKSMLVVIVILTAVATVFADGELFDTATAALHLEKGISHLKAKSYDAAIIELEEAVSIYPDAENYYYLGYAYYMKGRTGDSESRKSAIANFERVYELNPQFTPNRFKPENGVIPTHKMEAVSEQDSRSDSGEKPSDGSKTADKD